MFMFIRLTHWRVAQASAVRSELIDYYNKPTFENNNNANKNKKH